MKTDTPDRSSRPNDPTPEASTIFSLLADDRRRVVLHYLSRRVGAVPLGDVAERIALWEDDLSRDRYERIITGLFHIHVPRLTEAGLVRFDEYEETLELLPSADAVRPFLDLAVPPDGP